MAKTSGGNRGTTGKKGGLGAGDANYKGRVSNARSLSNINNRELYGDVTSAISRYHSVLGVRQQEVKLATLPDGVGGVHITANGKSKNIFLNSRVFENGTRKSVADWAKEAYKAGHLTKTNRPVAHIVTHELAHATWNSHLKGANHKAASMEIRRLYNSWKKDKSKSGYGRYAKTNVDEFWAETITKSVIGTNDKYSRKVKAIVKKYKL